MFDSLIVELLFLNNTVLVRRSSHQSLSLLFETDVNTNNQMLELFIFSWQCGDYCLFSMLSLSQVITSACAVSAVMPPLANHITSLEENVLKPLIYNRGYWDWSSSKVLVGSAYVEARLYPAPPASSMLTNIAYCTSIPIYIYSIGNNDDPLGTHGMIPARI